ncbi:enoyl-CoA hydratase-related protein [Lysinibacillus sp. Bpr_S20]|uniref:enoyl-CoA hydratase/isomerase family protein n=1 Tax=Lysinibacillus sp. Bpr_S20 TaxID=2933964 RepID=UPI0020111D25|nr:enoyl-CoA hydratase-related protein [Lysinibacillus sp. Bpr_S20]MCL1699470.1 enoyl-CoA hydratase-related protein [Lysinibacillus sp. Bpr_S20]
MNFKHLLVNVVDYVATITISRPPVNPLNSEVFEELNEIIDVLDRDDRVRAIIITGSGEKAFVAGADINEMNELDLVGVTKMNKVSRKTFTTIEHSTKPVIAAINGLALGGGFELALCCDFRIAADKAKFAFPELNLGIIPGGGGTQRLSKITGLAIAKELLYFGDTITAEQAYSYHIVNKVVPQENVLEEAQEWAGRLVKKPPIGLQALKVAVQASVNTDTESGLVIETTCFNTAFAAQDRIEGLAAFIEKRKPVFAGK